MAKKKYHTKREQRKARRATNAKARRKIQHRPFSAVHENRRALAADLAGVHKRSPRRRPHHPPTAGAIRALRQYLNLTQQSFAHQLSVTPLAVGWWETERRAPAKLYTERLRELAEMNNLNLDRLEDPEYYNALPAVTVFADRRKERTT